MCLNAGNTTLYRRRLFLADPVASLLHRAAATRAEEWALLEHDSVLWNVLNPRESELSKQSPVAAKFRGGTTGGASDRRGSGYYLFAVMPLDVLGGTVRLKLSRRLTDHQANILNSALH